MSAADALLQALTAFMLERVLPAEAEVAAWQADPATRWTPCPAIERLKAEARAAGRDEERRVQAAALADLTDVRAVGEGLALRHRQ